eukprot:COSAG04_NODE_8233_length_1004_cov_0.913812_1_plen_24_part_01
MDGVHAVQDQCDHDVEMRQVGLIH